MSATETAEPTVIATGKRGAQYVEILGTRSPDYVLVLTTRGARYAVRTESVAYLGGTA